ncbi:Holliday junction branch migration protein RuvA [Bacillus sp. JCM 19041]|uniref:Holliday junction branch migration protein RuvA n=1 Tax=Bacillus sp. JCM 19041 TaxID=1460637 RepID=UPI0006D1BCEC
MIDYIKGVLVEIEPAYLVVETNGVGYQIFCANPYRFSQNTMTELIVPTYHYVREDTQRLYGFSNKMERALFEKLLNVSGIGPKGALAILASGQPEHIVQAIEEEDDALLVRFPGVGKKTARQIILDLKGKLEEFSPSLINLSAQNTVNRENADLQDALEALRALGYVDKELKKVEKQLKNEDLETDGYIKRALALMLKT